MFWIMGNIMNSLKVALFGAAIIIGAASAANAADVYQRGSIKDTPDVYRSPIWTGVYFGVHAGAAVGGDINLDAVVEDADGKGDKSVFEGSADLDTTFIGGIHLGYNWQTDSNIVFGVEGSVSYLGLETEEFGEELTDYVASIRGRLGVAFDQNLIYATGGVAFLGYTDDLADALDEDVAVGFVVGGGFERKITENVSLGIEGLYYDVGTEIDAVDGELDLDTNFWTVTGRLNYHFNAGYDSPLK
jgi:outer membrane immunogenic protein